MNSLGYAILSLLVRKPCSGYEIQMLLDALWPAKHSQIYPLLNKLKENHYVTFEQVKQTGKPNKKIYSLTETGKEVLSEWVKETPDPPVQRDEFLIKAYALWLTNEEDGIHLIQDRLKRYQYLLMEHQKTVQEMEKTFGDEVLNKTSPQFGRYVLFKRRIQMDVEEINWCEWVLGLLR
ncbi:PadR family transcriptional regulator [Halobacillus salinarum]|uniref:PadR family transcriptional regulator n=1 Tax=Halobacillus salinarum TaxID=2932257 RepID=A0ABY4ENI4_9BACI|nr:PadR family transcriptional regulator [Halobacillus salinarum]UOQ45631.1 PadR family transcriptional regulator [Halobacillus salinarum]